MAFCKNCGANIDDLAVMCPTCGTNVKTQNIVTEPKKGNLNIGLLIWSIINMTICCSLFSLPLGIVGLVFTLMAKNKPTIEEEKKAIKVAMICNLIGTILAVILTIIGIVFIISNPDFFDALNRQYGSY